MSTRHRGRVLRASSVLALTAVVVASTPALATVRPDHVVKVRKVRGHGHVLFTRRGYALYTYAKDTKDHSNCTGSCLSIWPALTVPKGRRPTGTAHLGVITRAGGVRQVTWRGHPLYTYASDKRDAVAGNGVADFYVTDLTKKGSHKSSTTTTKSSGGYGW